MSGTRVNPKLAIFISAIRSKLGKKRQQEIVSQQKDMALVKVKNGKQIYQNMLKYLYLAITEDKIDAFEFINACGSSDKNIKVLGYLGSMLISDEKMFIMMINTLKKDLGNVDNRDLALLFLCNMAYKSEHFSELKDSVCIKHKRTHYNNITLICHYNLNGLNGDLKMVSNNENILFTKVQIFLKYMMENKDATILNENDVLFLISAYFKTTNQYLKLKLIQLFGYIENIEEITDSAHLFKEIEKSVISSGLFEKRYIEIGLSIEACHYLLKVGYSNVKTNTFVFRLIESKNANLIKIGMKFVRDFNVFKDLAIDKCFNMGLIEEDIIKTLIFLLDKDNYKNIYKRKDESVLLMEEKGLSEEKCNQIWQTIAEKIIKVADENFIVKLICENPDLCLKIPMPSVLSNKEMKSLYDSILEENNISYFELLYQLIPHQEVNSEHLNSIFYNHLNILCSKNFDNEKYKTTLYHLMTIMMKYGDIAANRNTILEFFNSKNSNFLKNMLLETLVCFNMFLDSKLLYIKENIFINYEFEMVDDKILFKVSYNPIYIKDIKVFNFTVQNEKVYDTENEITKQFLVSKAESLIINIEMEENKYKKVVYLV